MKEDFKQWLCELSKYDFTRVEHLPYWRQEELKILIKAMWAINRAGGVIEMGLLEVYVQLANTDSVYFEYKKHKNSEQEALTKALEYIYKETKNELHKL